MSLTSKTHAGELPSHEAIENHENSTTKPLDKAAMESASKANESIKKNEAGQGGIFTP